MALKGFIGQEELVSKLRRAISGKTLSHSYVLSGPEGIGKKTLARAFVSELVCTSPNSDGPCGKCNACKMYQANIPSDYIWLQPENERISVDDIRTIQNDIIIRPLYSDRKVYVIPGGEDMTVQAQNCLLKILEEPPRYAIIIIIAVTSDSLLPTVMSRVIHYELDKYSKNDLSLILTEKGIHTNPEYLKAIYGYSGGVPGKAIELIQSEQFVQMREDMIRLILSIIDDKLNLADSADYFESNKGEFTTLLNILQLFYRDALVMKNSNGDTVINTDKTEIVQTIERSLSMRKAVRNIQCISETQTNIKRNANFRLAVENMLLTLAED